MNLISKLFLGEKLSLTSQQNRTKKIFIYIFSIVGSIILIVYGVINYVIQDYSAAYFELFLGFSLLIGTIIIRSINNDFIPETIGAFVLFSIAFHNFYSGGFNETGLFWVFLYPAIIFFIKGRKKGLIWLFIFYCTMILVVFAHIYFPKNDLIPYSNITILTFLISFLTISFFVYFYQLAQEEVQKRLKEKSSKAEIISEQLQLAILRKKRTEQKMSKIVEQISLQNKELERTKIAMASLIEDIDKEKRNSEEDKERLTRILESIADGVLVLNAEKKVVILNDAITDLTGKTINEVYGQYYKEVFSFYRDEDGNDESRFIDDFYSIHKQTTSSKDATIKNSLGDLIPIYSIASPIVTSDMQLSGAVIIVRDTRKEREIDKMKTEFVSVASHQLKTPLTGAMWTLELLENKDIGKLNEEQTNLVKELNSSLKQMNDLVNELLNVSRIDRGEKFDIVKEKTDIIPIVNEAIKQIEKIAKIKNVSVNFTKSDEKIVLNIDPKKIHEAIKNLINNSVKYSYKDSEVEVIIEKEIAKKKCVIQVKDTGIGIPEEQKNKIFTKFFRASNARKNDNSGTGLGLYIVKAIIEGHEGEVSFESVEDKGTTFKISLPLP